jgi:hypothetical protein
MAHLPSASRRSHHEQGTLCYLCITLGRQLGTAGLTDHVAHAGSVIGRWGQPPRGERLSGENYRLRRESEQRQIALSRHRRGAERPQEGAVPLHVNVMKSKLRPGAYAAAPAGTYALFGGTTAVFADIQRAVNHDYAVVFPVAALIILVILAVLLRSLVAPWYLMLSATSPRWISPARLIRLVSLNGCGPPRRQRAGALHPVRRAGPGPWPHGDRRSRSRPPMSR